MPTTIKIEVTPSQDYRNMYTEEAVLEALRNFDPDCEVTGFEVITDEDVQAAVNAAERVARERK